MSSPQSGLFEGNTSTEDTPAAKAGRPRGSSWVLLMVLALYGLLAVLVVFNGYQEYQSLKAAATSASSLDAVLYRVVLTHGLLLVLMLIAPSILMYVLVDREKELERMQLQHEALQSQLRYQSFHDPLTSLPNRMLLEEQLNNRIATARRTGKRFLFLLASLTDFKRINKNLGYEIGDDVLRILAQNIVNGLRDADAVARFDGDVFAVIADINEKSEANIIARKVQNALSRPIDVADSPLTVTAAIGAAIFPDQGEDMAVLIKHADNAVTKARRSAGTNNIVFSEEDASSSMDRLALITGIKDAMLAGHLSMVYQPKLTLTAPDTHSFEALLRWQHPEHGLLPCDMYIPLVEQTRHILDLTHWTVENVFSTQRDLMEKGVNVSIAVNLSARVLDEDGFPLWVERMITQYGLNPASVRFEITESAIMQDSERALQVLLQLAAIGVGLSIDDFGVGHSSLAYLSRLPVDELKVDKSFVINMIKWESDRAIVRATISLAHDLGMSVVGEGVEDMDQAAMLREMECDMLQGYYISHPLSEEQLQQWISSQAA
ncbi:MAG TPA: bifunctional diguanylate cyclase/phosphodiesterase [Chromatiaceae bacterium]|nr:bifunctional diguanylate cyclase/phosphodiesterase [Chromatiaceae bacterium]